MYVWSIGGTLEQKVINVMANRKKSVETHVDNGTYRPSRHGKKDKVPDTDKIKSVPKAPDWLGKYGKQEYKRITESLHKMNLLAGCDLGILEIACREYQTYKESLDYLKHLNNGKLENAIQEYLLKRNSQTATITVEMKRSYKSYAEIIYKFGISPVERSRIQVEKKEKGDSPLKVFE